MDTPQIICQKEEAYWYIEVPQGLTLNISMIKQLKDLFQQAINEKKKILLCLSPNFKIDKQFQKTFFTLLKEQLKNRLILVSREGVKWGDVWKDALDNGLPMASKDKAVRWALENSKPGKITFIPLGKSVYIKCSGQAKHLRGKLTNAIERASNIANFKSKKNLQNRLIKFKNFQTWSFIHNTIIFDFTDFVPLDYDFLEDFKKTLAKFKLNADHPRLYFVTCNIFNTWLLEQKLGCDIKVVGNIVRVFSSNLDATENMEQEGKHLRNACLQDSLVPFILNHQVQGARNALIAIQQFFPDIIVVDDMADVEPLKKHLNHELKERIYHITPANDPRLRLLGPQLITKGYDQSLFADYLLTRHKNNHGTPNDTFFYYLETQPDYMKKVFPFFIMEFAYVLSKEYNDILQELAK